MNRSLAVCLALAALVLGACSAVTSSPAAPSPSPIAAEPTTIHVLEDPVDFTDVLVGSLTGCTTASTTGCQGDQLIGHSRLLDATSHEEVGKFLVSCFLVDPGQSLYTCPANTITLTGRGQIIFTESLLFREASAQEWQNWAPWPITGGTGEFLGATGTVDGPKDSTWPYLDAVITIIR